MATVLIMHLICFAVTAYADDIFCSFDDESSQNCNYNIDMENSPVAWQLWTSSTSEDGENKALRLAAISDVGMATFHIPDVADGTHCLSFIRGQSNGTLLRILYSRKTVYTSEDAGNEMMFQKVTLEGSDYGIRFEGTVYTINSMLVLDNIRISNGSCLNHEKQNQIDLDELVQSTIPAEQDTMTTGSLLQEEDLAPTSFGRALILRGQGFFIVGRGQGRKAYNSEYQLDDDTRHPNDNFPAPPTASPGSEDEQPAPLQEQQCSSKIRLSGSDTAAGRGRVEMCSDGEWGTICNDGWNNFNSKLICKQLGYSAGHVIDDIRDVNTSLRIMVDGLRCRRHHKHLRQCCRNELFVHDCTHAQDVYLQCEEEVSSRPCSSRDPSCREMSTNITPTDGVYSTTQVVSNDDVQAPPQGVYDGSPWVAPIPNPAIGVEEPVSVTGEPL